MNKALTKYITLIKDVYNNIMASVLTSDTDTDVFSQFNIRLQQGSD
jgi:hypothetical protein